MRKRVLFVPQFLWFAFSLAVLLIGASPDGATESRQATLDKTETAGREVERLLIVDCLLPGQVRKLGTQMTYVSARRAVKVSADECGIRGGEYVAYDRANLSTALKIWLPVANEGDKEAQTYVGEIYEKGIGSAAPDYGAAATWYQKAANQGYPRAMINLGFLYEKGLGVEKDPAAALNFYRKASGLEGLIGLDDEKGGQFREQEIQNLRQELEETKRQLDKARQELERQKSNNQSELDRLQKQKQQALDSGNVGAVKSLEAQLKQRESEIDKQRQEVARLEKSLLRYHEQVSASQSDSASLRSQLEQARQQLTTAEKELKDRKEKTSDDQTKLESVRSEVEKQKQATNQDSSKVKNLEAELKRRQEEIGRQSREISRVEQEAKQYKDQLAKLEASAKAKQPKVAMAPPSIELIDPPVQLMRNMRSIKVTPGIAARELVGKVTAAAGLHSFTVNGRGEALDANGLFKVNVELSKPTMPVSLVAVDNQGKRAVVEFVLVAGNAPSESPITAKTHALDFGNFYALVIGNAKYQKLPKLETTEADANAVAALLTKKYGFKVTVLMNASRYQMLSELNKLRGKLTEKDNLLVYYAGHGEVDRANLRGHWLPVDAEPESDANWISSIAITDILNAMTVKHALVVADSCYSGAMTRSSVGQIESGLSEDARLNWLKALAKSRSRTALTSGGVQPVMDGGGGKHSVFAQSFLDVLSDNQDTLEAQRLYREVAARVLDRANRFRLEQRPEYAPLKFAGHESGDFLFVPLN